MKVKTRIMVVTAVTTMGTLLALGGAVDTDDPCSQLPDGWPCSGWPLGGAWVQSVPPAGPMTPGAQPAIIYETLTPVDAAGNVFVYKQTYANADNTMGGILPQADLGGELAGTAVRTGPNTYQFTLLGYAGQTRPGDRGQILGIVVSSGTMTLIGPNTRIDGGLTMALYGPDADVNPADGLPDEGVDPLMCVPFGGDYVATRIPVLPPCTPTPMPPQP